MIELTLVPALLALVFVVYELLRVGQAFLDVAVGRQTVADVGLVARTARIEAELRDQLGAGAAQGGSGACPACGRGFGAGDRFCQGCGGALTLRCEACVLDLPADSRFCSRCGASLE